MLIILYFHPLPLVTVTTLTFEPSSTETIDWTINRHRPWASLGHLGPWGWVPLQVGTWSKFRVRCFQCHALYQVGSPLGALGMAAAMVVVMVPPFPSRNCHGCTSTVQVWIDLRPRWVTDEWCFVCFWFSSQPSLYSEPRWLKFGSRISWAWCIAWRQAKVQKAKLFVSVGCSQAGRQIGLWRQPNIQQ